MFDVMLPGSWASGAWPRCWQRHARVFLWFAFVRFVVFSFNRPETSAYTHHTAHSCCVAGPCGPRCRALPLAQIPRSAAVRLGRAAAAAGRGAALPFCLAAAAALPLPRFLWSCGYVPVACGCGNSCCTVFLALSAPIVGHAPSGVYGRYTSITAVRGGPSIVLLIPLSPPFWFSFSTIDIPRSSLSVSPLRQRRSFCSSPAAPVIPSPIDSLRSSRRLSLSEPARFK
mgnify:CR=1 FL=1